MQTTITIYKAELAGKEAIALQLSACADEVKITGDAFVYSPKPGKLFEFLNIVNAQRILYRTHVNSVTADSFGTSPND